MTFFYISIFIAFLILTAVIGYNSGYVNGNRNAIDTFDDWRKSFYARYEESDKDWSEAYSELNNDWQTKYSNTVENYERQIKILNSMLEKKRGEK